MVDCLFYPGKGDEKSEKERQNYWLSFILNGNLAKIICFDIQWATKHVATEEWEVDIGNRFARQ